MIGLIDCNNFFVSCERVVHPALRGKPVIVLSHLGGIVVARSNEAKALGIPMGAPLFQWRDFCEAHDVAMVLPRGALYENLSSRVMEEIASVSPDMECYSVDEAFVRLDGDVLTVARALREQILRRTGIPTSIGIAPTKTLAKVATFFAKQGDGILAIDESNRCERLRTLPVDEVWGIGSRLAERLYARRIYTAYDLAMAPDALVRRVASVIGLRIAYELRGLEAHGWRERDEVKQSLSMARLFPQPTANRQEVEATLACYTAALAEELRGQGSVCGAMQVWTITREESRSTSGSFRDPTDFTPTLITKAKELLDAVYESGVMYKKVGVCLTDLRARDAVQPLLFGSQCNPKCDRLMEVVDALNYKGGRGTVQFGAQLGRRS